MKSHGEDVIKRLRCLSLTIATFVAVVGGWTGSVASYADVTTFSYVTVVSAPGDYVGGGVPAEWWTPGGGSIGVSGNTTKVVVSTSGSGSGQFFQFTFAAPSGQDLAVGSYNGAQKASSAAAGRPGMDASGPRGACYGLAGQFVVSDIHFSDVGVVDRLRLHYEQHCTRSEDLTGDVVINETPADTTVLTVPEAATLTPTYTDTTSATADVRLVNEQSTPLTVSAASLTGVDAAKFQIVSNTCTGAAVLAGGNCLATVAFSPGQDHAAATAAVTFTDDSVAGSHIVPLSAAVQPGNTSWDMVGDVDDTAVGPTNIQGTPTTSTITADATPTRITATLLTNRPYPYNVPGSYTATFTLPDGQSFAAGDYPNATAAGSTSGPGLDLQAYSNCPSQNGSLHIDEFTLDPTTGELTALALTFVLHCDSSSAAAYGSIAWHATNPAPQRAGPGSPSDRVPPQPAGDVRTAGGGGLVGISWINPLDADYDVTIVREAVGTVAPSSPASGTAVYSGRGTKVIVKGLKPATSYTFGIWTRDTRNNYSPARSVSMHGTVTFLALPVAAPYGQVSPMFAEAIDVVTHKPIPFAPFKFYLRAPGSTLWSPGWVVRANATGVATGVIAPTHPVYVRAVMLGTLGQIGSSSPALLQALSPGVTGSYLSSLHPGATETFRGTIAPNLAGQRIYLQRHSGGVWSTYRSMLLTSKSTFAFSFPLRAGTYTFRLYMPAVRGFKPLFTQSMIVVVR